MFQKFLVVCVLAFSFSTAFAKGVSKKSLPKKETYKTTTLKFDYDVFLRLSKKDRYQYIKVLRDTSLAMDKARGTKTAWMEIEKLLIPQAEAESGSCWNGGIAYKAENCDPRVTQVPSNPAADSFITCGAGESRCGAGLGLKLEGDKLVGACYSSSKYGHATSICQSLLGGGDSGIQTLTNALNDCEHATTTHGLNCDKLKAAIVADTAGYDDYCANGRYKSTCNTFRGKTADVRNRARGVVVDPNAPEGEVTQGAASCAAVDHKVTSEALKKALGQGIDPKWLRLVLMTEKTCGLGNFDLVKQLKKFGACKSNARNVEPPENVEKAISQVMGRGDMRPADVGAFRNYFGIEPNEYKNIFCRTENTLKFAEAMSKLSVPNGSDYAASMTDYLLEMKASDLRGWIGKMNESRMGQSYKDLNSWADMKTRQDLAQAQLDAANAKLTANPEDFGAKQDKDRANSELASIRPKLATLKFDIRQALSKPTYYGYTKLYNGLGAANYDALKTQFDEKSFSDALNSGTATPEGNQQRKALMACAKSSINVNRKGGDDFNGDTVTAESNFTSSCWNVKMTNKATDFFVHTFGSYSIQSMDGKSCYFASGATRDDKNCASGKALVVIPGDDLDKGTSAQQSKCLDGLENNYIVHEMNCSGKGDYGTFRCSDGTDVPKNAEGEWNCNDHGGTPVR